ncbi:conserved hypothetical protein [Pseudarthrobacter chlorophenolicus A6]|uniref:Uncharacterized protein n=1 Tax=Pseudarthrobacter chlorophenolicus (strain ATCC 700700 / DSM 12829 / CIP 107037 / JCM 12360 / KCTC 9906 / NCIMB 13794 / A6) TaxID=452863 RepID=B8HG42_PSECP|nr:hypothetical protein [Pseudarthrobacter chlorophenolicus]ACL39404.1 conserved hypothetical protein [Pseudarthrobacter chlorophenolicus A6]SDQ99837.1 hypothetical protein SAMN04489738_4107 [Pseudarthrobacter chlorophenolicus]
MTALWIAAALLAAGFGGWPVTALVFRLARTIDDKADAAAKGRDAADDPSADVTVDLPGRAPDQADQAVNGELTAAAGQPASDVPAAPAQRILRGGAIIGVLERLGVCLAILAGQPVAIAYIVAIKGLGRFAELKETPVAAERFIIGTLASMLWAAGIAAAVKVIFLA